MSEGKDMDVIDLSAERDKRNGPDANCIIPDSDGRPMYLFAVDWRHDDRTWTVQICAYDRADAEARVRSMRESAVVFGQVLARGRVPWFESTPKE